MQLHDLQPFTPIFVALFGLVGILISKSNGKKLDEVRVNVDGNLSKALQEIEDLKIQVNLLLSALNKDKSPKEQEGLKAL